MIKFNWVRAARAWMGEDCSYRWRRDPSEDGLDSTLPG